MSSHKLIQTLNLSTVAAMSESASKCVHCSAVCEPKEGMASLCLGCIGEFKKPSIPIDPALKFDIPTPASLQALYKGDNRVKIETIIQQMSHTAITAKSFTFEVLGFSPLINSPEMVSFLDQLTRQGYGIGKVSNSMSVSYTVYWRV